MTSSITFNLETAQELFNSDDQYPVDFDLAWQWLGYARKDNCKRMLISKDSDGESLFQENVDYCFLICAEAGVVNVSQLPEKIDCFKQLGMLSKSSSGKIIRNYFLQCEQIAKDFHKKHQETAVITQKAHTAIATLKEIEGSHPVTYQMAIQALSIPIDPRTQLHIDNALDSSLIINRLGLAFNKDLKAIDILKDSYSPDAVNKLKEAYDKLALDFANLLSSKASERTAQFRDTPETLTELAKAQGEAKHYRYLNQLLELKVTTLERQLKTCENKLNPPSDKPFDWRLPPAPLS
jgi:phage anti-repressor protein